MKFLMFTAIMSVFAISMSSFAAEFNCQAMSSFRCDDRAMVCSEYETMIAIHSYSNLDDCKAQCRQTERHLKYEMSSNRCQLYISDLGNKCKRACASEYR